MARKRKDLDQLTRDSLEAERRGISYGKLIAERYEKRNQAAEQARQREIRREKEEAEAQQQQRAIERGRRTCVLCGKPLPPFHKKYCPGLCSDIRLQEIKKRQNERKMERKAAENAEEQNI